MTDPDECSILILGAFGLIIFLFLSAFFSASETALFSLDKFKYKKLQKEEDNIQIQSIINLLDNPKKTLITILIGNMFVNISASSLATYIAIKIVGNIGIGVASIVMICLIIIFGEVVPKSLAIADAEEYSKKVARPIEIVSYLLFPLIKFSEIIMNLLYFFPGKKNIKKKKEITEEDLLALINISQDEGVIKKREKDMIMNIFEFKDTTVKNVMVPRVDILCMSFEIQLESILKIIKKSGHSRIPIYEGTIDNIIGILCVKDLLKVYKEIVKKKDFDLNNIIRKAFFVPENKKIIDLLNIFQRDKIQIAIVLDEYGGTSGLVTIEDIAEEIVGEIIDEYDKESKIIEIINENTVATDGIISIDEINEILHTDIPKEDFETLAGFICNFIGRIPKEKEIIKYQNIEIQIDCVVKNRIRRVKISTQL